MFDSLFTVQQKIDFLQKIGYTVTPKRTAQMVTVVNHTGTHYVPVWGNSLAEYEVTKFGIPVSMNDSNFTSTTDLDTVFNKELSTQLLEFLLKQRRYEPSVSIVDFDT